MLNQIAIALGISPAKKVIDFAPNKEETITFNLINNENRDLRVFVEISGELAEYIQIPNNIVTIKKDEKSRGLDLEIILPENVERPGLIESTVKVSRISAAEQGAIQISTMPSIKAKLQLRVPYPSKYIESMLVVDKDDKEDKKVRFVMPIFNYGVEDIENARAFLKIFDNENNLMRDLETESTSIDSGSQAKLSSNWQAETIGSYYATADIDYDGEKLELKESFDIGAPFVNITKIIVNNFRLGDIAKFDIYLKSDWNDIINVYADATIFKDDKIYLSSKTEPIDLFVGEENIINLYWGTANVAEGDYNLSLTIKHMLGESTHIVKLVVNEDSIITSLTPERIVSGRDIIIYLTVAIVILIVVNVLWYIKKFRKR
ncbi:hypothetical protein CMO87_01535 [Candidatus Woesearchaeota archaeon]|nr:hypothetical protein [Candidatus Woesearchaeota archaeon]